MFNKTRKTVAAVGEALGIVVPSVPDAKAAAETRRMELVAAQSAVDGATAELEAGHDRTADDGEIVRLESVLADARLTADRAQRATRAAEKRLQTAVAAEKDKGKEISRANLDVALAEREAAARTIDEAAVTIAKAIRVFNETDPVISTAMRDGVAVHGVPVGTQRLVEHALQRAGAMPSVWIGDKSEQPTAAQLHVKTVETLLAVN